MLLAELNEQIEKWFHCMIGPPAAYFELPVPDPNQREIVRYVYETLAFGVSKAPAPAEFPYREAQEQLVSKMYTVFENARNSFHPNNPLVCLFWRRTLAFSVDNGDAQLSCRVVIPGYLFPESSP